MSDSERDFLERGRADGRESASDLMLQGTKDVRAPVPLPPRSVGFLLGEIGDRWSIQEVASAVEISGGAAFWVVDHILWHRPMPECFAAVAMAAAATDRVVVGPCVLQVPLRNAVEIAKWSAFLQHATSGRFVLGVGIGEHEGEYRGVGADFQHRGASLDCALDSIEAALSRDVHDGLYRVDPRPRFPVWVGGRSHAAIRRAARRCDGWIPHFVDPVEFAVGREHLRREAERSGRDPDEIVTAATVFVSVEEEAAEHEKNLEAMAELFGLPSRALKKRLIAGTAREVAESFERFWDAGAHHLAAMIFSHDPVERFARLVGECAARGGATCA